VDVGRHDHGAAFLLSPHRKHHGQGRTVAIKPSTAVAVISRAREKEGGSRSCAGWEEE
jgi:hypothetical protein